MVVISYVRAAVSATASAIWALSLRRWGLLSLGSSLLYLWNISTLSSRLNLHQPSGITPALFSFGSSCGRGS